MRTHRVWFVVLADRLRLPLPVLGLGIAGLLATLFLWLLGGFVPDAFSDQSNHLSNVGTGLFFAAVNGYAIAAGNFVVRRALLILQDLEPHLSCSEQELQEARGWISGGSRTYLVILLLISLSAGSLHAFVLTDISGNVLTSLFGNPLTAAQNIGTLMSWFVISHLISQSIVIAQTFARLGTQHMAVDLLNPDHLAPFSRIALLPALSLIGLQMLYPLLSLGGTFNPAAVVPGFLLGLGSLLYLLIAPNLGLRRKVRAAKHVAIAQINDQISTWQAQHQHNDPMALAGLQPLLQHRTYLQGVPEWPLGLASLLRWGFYVVIPPLTWAAAALMEIAIDAFIS